MFKFCQRRRERVIWTEAFKVKALVWAIVKCPVADNKKAVKEFVVHSSLRHRWEKASEMVERQFEKELDRERKRQSR